MHALCMSFRNFQTRSSVSCSYRKYRKHHENVEAPSPCLKWDFSNWLWKLHGRMREAYQGLSVESGCQWFYNCGQRLHTAGSHWDVRICQNISNINRYHALLNVIECYWQLVDWLWLESIKKDQRHLNDCAPWLGSGTRSAIGWSQGRLYRPLAWWHQGRKTLQNAAKCQENESTWINIAADIAWVGGTLCLRVWKAWKNHRNFAKSFCRAAHIKVVKSTTSLPVSFEIPK